MHYKKSFFFRYYW